MGASLVKLAGETPKQSAFQANMEQERDELQVNLSVAIDGDAFRKGVMGIGHLTPFTCPECHGVLVKVHEGKLTRYRCHTGHAYTARDLAHAQGKVTEDAIWAAVRALHEKETLFRQLEKRAREANRIDAANEHAASAERAHTHANILRRIASE